MELKHKCIWCSSPCEITLAFTSEGCSNPRCRAYKGFSEEEVKALRDKVKFIGFAGISTGRFSASGSNPSNVPRPERRLVADVMARSTGIYLSREQMDKLLEAPDIYAAVAELVFSTTAVTPAQWDSIKSRVLGAIYGHEGQLIKDHVEATFDRTPPLGFVGVDLGRKESTTGVTVAYSRLDAELTQKVYEANVAEEEVYAKKMDALQQRIQSWPNTMRIVVDPGSAPRNKDGKKLLGVLSLVDVGPKGQGRVGIYDYISVRSPDNVRCRFMVRMEMSPAIGGKVRVEAKRGYSPNFEIRMLHCPPQHSVAMRSAMALVLEAFEDRLLHPPEVFRRLTESEEIMMNLRRERLRR